MKLKIKNVFYLLLLIVIFLNSCRTYTKFYSKTHKLTELPSKFSDVNRLDLSHQDLNTTQLNIADFTKLKMLNLSGNKELSLDNIFKRITYPEQIEILILDSLLIKTLPKSILRFNNLKHISLAHNPNLDINDTFIILKNLPIKFLNLKDNNIKKLPKSITRLTTLKDLNLSYNNLTDSLSYDYLGSLPKLYSVWIDHNNLNELPNTIGALKQIRFFYIDNNHLKKLPKAIKGMKALWVIHAGYNKFSELPEEFASMKSLLMIHINNNNISSIPQIYQTEKFSFKGLLLDNNPISTDKEAIQQSKKIFKGFFLLSFQQKVYDIN